MFDITQIRSALNNKNLKEDVEYIDNLLEDAIYAEEFNENVIDINIPNYKEEIELLKKSSHTHENLSILKRITNSMINNWNSKSPTKMSHLINDMNLVDEEYINNRIAEITGHDYEEIILTSNDGSNFILSCDREGNLITTGVNIENNKISKKIVLKSPNGSSFLLHVDNDGVLNPIKLEGI